MNEKGVGEWSQQYFIAIIFNDEEFIKTCWLLNGNLSLFAYGNWLNLFSFVEHFNLDVRESLKSTGNKSFLPGNVTYFLNDLTLILKGDPDLRLMDFLKGFFYNGRGCWEGPVLLFKIIFFQNISCFLRVSSRI